MRVYPEILNKKNNWIFNKYVITGFIYSSLALNSFNCTFNYSYKSIYKFKKIFYFNNNLFEAFGTNYTITLIAEKFFLHN